MMSLRSQNKLKQGTWACLRPSHGEKPSERPVWEEGVWDMGQG